MKINRAQIIKYIIIFLAIMLFFTIVSNKINYAMMPEVSIVAPSNGLLSREITANGYVENNKVVFRVNIEKEPYIVVGDRPTAEFSNIKERVRIIVESKEFDAETQSIKYICRFDKPTDSVYDGQNCYIRFSYALGSFESVLPKECVITEGGKSFIYRLETVSSVVGESNIVRKIEVTILEQDDYNAAISGSISNYDTIVRYSTKPLGNELKVRVAK